MIKRFRAEISFTAVSGYRSNETLRGVTVADCEDAILQAIEHLYLTARSAGFAGAIIPLLQEVEASLTAGA